MQRLMEQFASGDWLTISRVRAYCAILLLIGAVAIAALFFTAAGVNDYQGRPLGTDFSNIYAAGRWVLAGEPASPFEPARQHFMERQLFGAETPFYGWHYPPPFLGVAALLATLPYLPALLLWQAATLALYLRSMAVIVRRSGVSGPPPGELWWLLALAYPAVFINVAHGHNGLLTAALIGGGLLLLGWRPRLAGVLLGCLCYKPQFGLLIPIALAAGGHWRSFGAAAATVFLILAASWLAFGTDTWIAFRDSLEFTRTIVIEQGGTGFYKIQSLFAALRAWGAPLPFAYVAQAALTLAVTAAVIVSWRQPGALAPKAAALIAGALLATPYVLDYDLVAAAPAIAFLVLHGVERGFLPYERTALAAIFVAPLMTRTVAEATGVPLGLIALLVLFLLALRRARADADTELLRTLARAPTRLNA